MRNSRQIFPTSVIEQDAEGIFKDDVRHLGMLYFTVLMFLVAAFCSLFYIYVDVTVGVPGTVKSDKERTPVYAPASGLIQKSYIEDNKEVSAGDTLLVISPELAESKRAMLEKRKSELVPIIADLSALVSRDVRQVSLKSPMYKQDVLHFLNQLSASELKVKQMDRNFVRARKLYEKRVIPVSEYEQAESEFVQASSDLAQLSSYQKRQWQSDLYSYRSELREISTQLRQIDIQSEETIVTATIPGVMFVQQEILPGTYVSSGQQIFEISPNGSLVVECYVRPKDIGLIEKGMKGRAQVSAFDHTEWGDVGVVIVDILEDVVMSSDISEPYYKVRCSLDSDILTLKNGFQGRLKRGMSVRANFVVARRSLFNLIYDKVDDWMNPYVSESV